MLFDHVVWYEPSSTLTISPNETQYEIQCRNPLYTILPIDNGVEIGLPGVPRDKVALKEKDGFLEVFVADGLVYQVKIPKDVKEVKSTMKDGLLTINWVARDGPVKITFV